MNERRLYILVLLVGMSLSLSAQHVVDRSSSRRPDWFGQVVENHLVTSAVGRTIDEAQRKCLDAVKVQMLESVAQNIEYSTETVVQQLTHNQDVQSDISFRQRSKTGVANLPYISGVSLAKAKGSYWECVRDGQSGALSYVYSLLYPYPESESQLLKSEFDKLDAAMTEIVRREEARLSDVGSIDTLEAAIANLEMAENYFFDRHRKDKARDVIKKYENVFGLLNVESKRIDRCKFRCWITWNGNVMECSSLPKCKSDAATKIRCTVDDGSYVITFSDEDCIGDDDNRIDVTFRFKTKTLKHVLHF